MIINRTLSEKNLDRLINDFSFLKKQLVSFKGELDLQFRDNYLNLYFRGYSVARIGFKPNKKYEIKINKKFWDGLSSESQARFQNKIKGDYATLEVEKKLLHPLLQKTNLLDMTKAIKAVGKSEELAFEQLLISDNLDRDDFVIIDRQVTDTATKGRLDLLALRRLRENQFQFVVVEVKMGNNKELRGAVGKQLDDYIQHIEDPKHFADYKECYESQYQQKKAFGLFQNPKHNKIEIVEGVAGFVVVGGYAGQAEIAIGELRKVWPKIDVRLMKMRI